MSLLFLVMASGIHLYKHVCYDCNEVEWSLLSSHEHSTEDFSGEHAHHILTDFHHTHETHASHCEVNYFKIDKPFVDSHSLKLEKPIELDLVVSNIPQCLCMHEEFYSIIDFEKDLNLTPPLDVTRMFEVFLL